jgi:hypothetical protein
MLRYPVTKPDAKNPPRIRQGEPSTRLGHDD